MRNFVAWLFTNHDGERAPITHFTDACCSFTGLVSHHSAFKPSTWSGKIGNDVADDQRGR